MTWAHLAVSLRMKAPKAAADIGVRSTPKARASRCTCGAASTAASATYIFASTCAGGAAGATTPNQPVDS